MRLALAAVLCLAACGDNKVPGTPHLRITAADALHTTEAGGTAMFTVGFDVAPETTFPVTLASSNPQEGTVAPTEIQLSPDDFDGVLVTVIGHDDDLPDGDQPYKIHVDAGVLGQEDVDVINDDDEGTGGMATVTAQSATTSEAGGTATFTVVLTSKPTATVTIPVTSTRTDEGAVSTSQLVFDGTNWDTPQTVTVMGIDDAIDDGDQAYAAVLGPATSSDPRFAGFNPDDVALTNTDDDTKGTTVSTISGTTSEAGTTATFTVVLASQPTADVTITLASDDTTEGVASPGAITFTTADWDQPKTITVMGVDDTLDDNDIVFHVVLDPATSTDASYAGIDPPDVTVTNVDDDGASITVTAPVGGLQTDESGKTDSFTLVLTSQPTDVVTVPVMSNAPTEGLTQIASVTFTTLDWNVPHEVFVTGQDDTIVDGAVAYTIVVGAATTTDPTYNGFDPPDVPATNADNDTALISVFPTDGLFVSELGDADSFDIVLTQAPVAPVTIPLASGDPTEGSLAVTSVTFTQLDWNIPQTVTVTGVDDPDPDGNITFSIITGAAQSFDPVFAGVNPPDVTVTNFDNETANVFVQARKTLATTENGGPSGSATFRVRLTTTPAAPVTCTLASSDLTEGQVAPQTLVFTNTNFQTVTITGVDDAVPDGDVRYFVITAPCTSADPDYDQRNPRDVAVLNRDND